MEEENSNNLLLLGISILGFGLILGYYSISCYLEVKNLNDKIDLQSIANDNDISTSDKYYKYLSIDDYLEQNLNKNKNIPLKNISCVYLDYAQQNAIELYNLTNRKLDSDDSKRSVATGTIRKLYNTLDYYKTCKQTESYKQELKDILKEIEQSQNLHIDSEQRMNEFLNSRNELPNSYTEEQTPNKIQGQIPTDDVNQTPQQLPQNIQQQSNQVQTQYQDNYSTY